MSAVDTQKPDKASKDTGFTKTQSEAKHESVRVLIVCGVLFALFLVALGIAYAQEESANESGIMTEEERQATQAIIDTTGLKQRFISEIIKDWEDGTGEPEPVLREIRTWVSLNSDTSAAEELLAYVANDYGERAALGSRSSVAVAIELWLEYLDYYPEGIYKNKAIGYLAARGVNIN